MSRAKRGEPHVRLYGDRGTLLRWIDQKELNHLRACSAVDDIWWHRVDRDVFLGVQLCEHLPSQRTSAASLTKTDILGNAGITAGDPMNPYPDVRSQARARDKVRAWPQVHDHLAPIVSAGRAYGVQIYCPWPKRIYGFAP